MNYLFLLLGALTPEELLLLSALRLTPTERKVFDFLVARTADTSHFDSDPSDVGQSELGLTPNSLYKNSSVLLQKAYAALAPTVGDAQSAHTACLRVLEFLFKKKSLIQNGLRELKRQESSAVATMTSKGKELYYFGVFHLLRSAERVEIPMAYFAEYGEKYLKARANPSALDKNLSQVAIRLYIEQRQFTKDIKQTAKRLSLEYAEAYLLSLHAHASEIEALNKTSSDSTNSFAVFNLHAAYSNFYYQTRTEPEERRAHLAAMLELVPAELNEDFPWLRPTIELEFGTIHLQLGEYQEAYDFYTSKYHGLAKEFASIRIPMDFFIAALWTGDYNRAQTIIHEIYRSDIERSIDRATPSRTSVLAEMWTALLYLNWEKYNEAQPHLVKAAQWNQGEAYSPYNESLIRIMEMTLAFLRRDWCYVDQLLSRDRQWLRRNEFTSIQTPDVLFVDLVKGYVDHINDGKPLREDLEAMKGKLFSSEVAGIIGKLLGKMRAIAVEGPSR